MLTTDDVEPGVAAMVAFIAIEVSMTEDTKLVVLFDPVKPGEMPRATPHCRRSPSIRRPTTAMPTASTSGWSR